MNKVCLMINEENFLFDSLETAQTVQRLILECKGTQYISSGGIGVNYYTGTPTTAIFTGSDHITYAKDEAAGVAELERKINEKGASNE